MSDDSERRAEEAERAVTSLRSMLLRAENDRDEWKARWEHVFVDRAKLSNQVADIRSATIRDCLRAFDGPVSANAEEIRQRIVGLLDASVRIMKGRDMRDHMREIRSYLVELDMRQERHPKKEPDRGLHVALYLDDLYFRATGVIPRWTNAEDMVTLAKALPL